MATVIKNRTLIRLICFVSAALLALAGAVIAANIRARGYRREMELAHMRALQEASGSLHSISVDLEKSTYAGTPSQIAGLSAQVWKNAGTAKQSLAGLPMDHGGLEVTYRFLSQVGDYALYLSGKAADGGEITEEERRSLYTLMDYAETLSEQLAGIEQVVSSGEMEMRRLWAPVDENTAVQLEDAVGFASVEKAMEGYPKLIYDGPFSDNLLEREPELTKGLEEVPRVEAQKTAARFAGVEPLDLRPGPVEESTMPSYTFTGEALEIGVTKAGGFVTYMTDARVIGQRSLTVYDARRKAAAYLLEMLETAPMKESYYEVAGGICTVNFAARQDNVTLYTDLVKVGVALDDGSVVFYDARGYINNHRERALEQPALGKEAAVAVVGGGLEIQSAGLALIPTSGTGEALTYEFRCKGLEGRDVLVYVNAETGREEQILIVLQDENGVLTV